MRRAYLDLVGTIPTVSQVRDFLELQSPDKRFRLVDELLAEELSNAHLARTWRRILAPAQAPRERTADFEIWLGKQFAADTPYDHLVRRMVTAGGAEEEPSASTAASRADANDRDGEATPSAPSSAAEPGAVAYLQATGGDPASIAGAISRDFLGVRIECAQCHDHPFASWKQGDFWGVAAFFAGASLNQPPMAGSASQAAPRDRPVATITAPELGKTFDAALLGDAATIAPSSEKLPRQVLAEWLTSPDNPHFAATAVNRTWRQLCGRGLTVSVDDLDAATPEERAVLLDDLAHHFVAAGFDLKWLIAGICKSEAYQFAAAGKSTSDVVGVRPTQGAVARAGVRRDGIGAGTSDFPHRRWPAIQWRAGSNRRQAERGRESNSRGVPRRRAANAGADERRCHHRGNRLAIRSHAAHGRRCTVFNAIGSNRRTVFGDVDAAVVRGGTTTARRTHRRGKR